MTQGEQEGNQPSGRKINHYCCQYLCHRCGKNWLFWRIVFGAISTICDLLFEANSVTIAQPPPAWPPFAACVAPALNQRREIRAVSTAAASMPNAKKEFTGKAMKFALAGLD